MNIESNISEKDITRAIVGGFLKDFYDYAESDVIVVGAGPCGATAAMLLAREGVKVLLLEKDIKPGGGMWQGGMLFPKMVVEKPANLFLESFGIKLQEENGYFVADSYYVSAKLLAQAFEHGVKMFNSVRVQDVIYRQDGLKGVVVNWQQVAHLTAQCVDPLSLESKIVIDATGHHADVARVVSEKIGLPGFVGREGSMWVEKAEEATVENTKEIYPNLIVAGMAANSVSGMPRMGPIFGGMFLSGVKAAQLALQKLKGKSTFEKNNISKTVLTALATH
ncbi:MAG: sulfide-dependent adenosine diphosphate thiazole synthase [Candidatus Micrarchaeia archaeon]